MQPGLACWGLRKTSLPEQLAMTKRLGVDLLELGIVSFPNDFLQQDATEDQVKKAAEMFKAVNLTPVCGAAGNDFTLPTGKENLDSLERTKVSVRLAGELGVKYLRIFSGFEAVEKVTGERWNTMIRCLKEVYAYARGTGVMPVMETHGGVTCLDDGSVRHFLSPSTRQDTLDRILEEIPELQLNFDPANLFVLGLDPVAYYKRYNSRIKYMHLKDFVPFGKGFKPAACGESSMDWKGLLSAVKSYKGPALIEYEIPDDVEDGFRKSLDFIRKQEI